MAFASSKVTSVHQVSGGLSESSGLWTFSYSGLITDLTTDSAGLKNYLERYGITNDDWVMVKLPIASSMGIVVVTTTNAKLKLLAFV